MKIALIAVFFLYLIGNSCAQTAKPLTERWYIQIPLYRADKRVDSLIHIAIKETRNPSRCFVFGILRTEEYDIIEVCQADQKQFNYILNPVYRTTKVWGYCETNDNIVFIIGDRNDPRKFFSKGKKLRKFHFMWHNLTMKELLNNQTLYSALYKYKDGKLSPLITSGY